MNQGEFGRWGEEKAVSYLVRKNYHILARNYRCNCGEIDIIAQYENTICFVEVKTRSSVRFGLPNEAVTLEKQRKLTRTALTYLTEFQTIDKALRMDIIEILYDNKKKRYYLRHIENAFPFSDLDLED